MQAFRSTLFLLIVAFAQNRCGPQGQVVRTIHPPLNLKEQRPEDQSEKTSSFQRTRSGLPAHCRQETRARDLFCLSCDEGGIDLERCFPFRGPFDALQNCVYSAESIKCLNPKPPFALTMPLRGSLEKSLIENTRLWQESLRSIAQPGLSPELQEELEKALQETEGLVKLLVKARKSSHWIETQYGREPAALKKALAELQRHKETGQLKLAEILRVSRMLLEASGTPPSLLSYWEALSVEGLEEPGD